MLLDTNALSASTPDLDRTDISPSSMIQRPCNDRGASFDSVLPMGESENHSTCGDNSLTKELLPLPWLPSRTMTLSNLKPGCRTRLTPAIKVLAPMART